MKQPYQIDLGVVHIHKKVVADIVASAVAGAAIRDNTCQKLLGVGVR